MLPALQYFRADTGRVSPSRSTLGSEVDPKGGGFKRGDDNPLDCDLLVVDETSWSMSC